jgi:Flp pilus assembly secretin CpaC
VVVDKAGSQELLEVLPLRRTDNSGSIDLMLVGKAVGRTVLRLRDDLGIVRYEVSVEPKYPDVERRIEEALAMPSVRARQLEGTIILTGEVPSAEESQRAEKVALLYHPVVTNLLRVMAPEKPEPPAVAKPDPEAQAEDIRKAIGMPDVTVRMVKDSALLEGNVDRLFERQKAQLIAASFGCKVINALTANEPGTPSRSVIPVGESAATARGPGVEGGTDASTGMDSSARPLPSRSELAAEIETEIGIPTVKAEVTWGVAAPEPLGPFFTSRTTGGLGGSGSGGQGSSTGGDSSGGFPGLAGLSGLLSGTGMAGSMSNFTGSNSTSGNSSPTSMSGPSLVVGNGAPVRGLAEHRPVAPRYPDMTVILRGSVKDQIELQKAYQIAGLYATPLNLLTVEKRLHAKLALKLVEVNRGALKDTGIDWQVGQTQTFQENLPTEGGALRVGSFRRTTPLTFSALLTALVQKNQAKVLAEPTQVAESGGTAMFQVGGYFPVPRVTSGSLGGALQTDVQFVPFGVILQMAPVITDNQQVRLKIMVQVSSLDKTNGATVSGTTVPAIRSRSTESDVTLKPGETLTIGGLFQQEDIRAISKLPLLGDLPILGALFRSKQFQKKETELVISVTPEIE